MEHEEPVKSDSLSTPKEDSEDSDYDMEFDDDKEEFRQPFGSYGQGFKFN